MSPWLARLLGYIGIRLVDRLMDRRERDAQPAGNSVDTDIIGGAEAPREDSMAESRWQYFSAEELQCRCCGAMEMDGEFMRQVVALRRQLGFPFPVTSAYRCPAHNAVVSSTGPSGPHTTGKAIDITVSGRDAMRLLQAALNTHYFTGIGINQRGNGRFIHLDALKGPEYPRPTIWTYP